MVITSLRYLQGPQSRFFLTSGDLAASQAAKGAYLLVCVCPLCCQRLHLVHGVLQLSHQGINALLRLVVLLLLCRLVGSSVRQLTRRGIESTVELRMSSRAQHNRAQHGASQLRSAQCTDS